MHDTLFETLIWFIDANGAAESQIAQHQCVGGLCTCSTPNVRRRWPCVSQLAATEAAYRSELRQAAERGHSKGRSTLRSVQTTG